MRKSTRSRTARISDRLNNSYNIHGAEAKMFCFGGNDTLIKANAMKNALMVMYS
jgi:hypothetical protein